MEKRINTTRSRSTVQLMIVLCILTSVLFSGRCSAKEGPSSAGASYLTLPVGPTSISMGEVNGAIFGDQFNWIKNPGTFHYINGLGVGISHSEWIADTRYDNLSFHQRINNLFILGAGFTYLYRPEIQGYDEFGVETEQLKCNNYNAVIGIGVSPIDYFTAGVNVKYFNEKLADWNAGGIGFDIGAFVFAERYNLAFGVAVQNLGPDIRFESLDEPLPTTIRLGISHTAYNQDSNIGLAFAVDAVKTRFDELYFCGGGEIALNETISIRVGYSGQKNREGNGLTMGGGFKLMDKIEFDYAWTPYADLGSFHRIAFYFQVH